MIIINWNDKYEWRDVILNASDPAKKADEKKSHQPNPPLPPPRRIKLKRPQWYKTQIVTRHFARGAKK